MLSPKHSNENIAKLIEKNELTKEEAQNLTLEQINILNAVNVTWYILEGRISARNVLKLALTPEEALIRMKNTVPLDDQRINVGYTEGTDKTAIAAIERKLKGFAELQKDIEAELARQQVKTEQKANPELQKERGEIIRIIQAIKSDIQDTWGVHKYPKHVQKMWDSITQWEQNQGTTLPERALGSILAQAREAAPGGKARRAFFDTIKGRDPKASEFYAKFKEGGEYYHEYKGKEQGWAPRKK
jgi:hypothetical protein